GGAALWQARADRTIFRHAHGAHVPHAEVCAWLRPRLYAACCRRRKGTGLAGPDTIDAKSLGCMSSTLDQDVAAFETHRRALTGLLPHARLARRGGRHRAGRLSALAYGRPGDDRATAPLSWHRGDAALPRSYEVSACAS